MTTQANPFPPDSNLVSSSTAIGLEHVLIVRRRGLRWEVARNGVVRRMIDWLCTRERGIEHALEMAGELLAAEPRSRVLVAVEGFDGTLRVLSSPERPSEPRIH
jgi:hypothetical protein